MNTPAVTIVAAWISALTGVGPSIASGSQVWSGKLRRLAHRSDEQQQAQQGHRVDAHAGKADRRSGHSRRGVEDRRDRHRAEHQEGAEDAEAEAEIADPVDDERLESGGIGGGLVVPEADQEIGSEADAFPTEEHLDQAVGGHQHQHREAEQREIGEETGLARILFHVAPAVEVHEARHGCHDDQHHCGQAVDSKCPIDVERTRMDPVEHRHQRRLRVRPDISEENDPAEESADEERPGRHDLCSGLADPATAKAGNDRCQKRQEDDEGQQMHQPLIRSTASTSIVPRRRKKMTRIASPIAASAAATVRTNIASTWPVRSPR